MNLVGSEQHRQASTTAVRKVMFKQRVLPNDQVFILISNIEPIQ